MQSQNNHLSDSEPLGGSESAGPKELIPRALSGDLDALEAVLTSVKDQVFNLCVRFLWHPQDAEDACQEILVKIMLHLNQFQFRSAFSTWSYRIAMNYLIDAKKSRLERMAMEFSLAEAEIARVPGSSDGATTGRRFVTGPSDIEAKEEMEEMAREVKTACSHAMLQCLDRNGRAAFILGEAFGMDSRDASYVLDISPDAYRQRLSRARRTMDAFLEANCGLKNSRNPCRCHNRACEVQSSSTLRRYLAYSRQLERHSAPAAEYDATGPLHRMAWIYRTNQNYVYRPALLDRVRRHLASLRQDK